jgi:hypothetical protein
MAMQGYSLNGYYRLKQDTVLEPKIGPIKFYTDDVFTKNKDDGTYTVHTGVMMFGIKAADELFEFHEGTAKLVGC